MDISIIAAMGTNRVIGKNNHMMWKIPSEHRHYRKIVGNHYFLMGRKNFDSHFNREAKPELNREKTLILTRSLDYKENHPSDNVFTDVNDAIAYAKAQGESELFILGGSEIYALLLPYTRYLYLSIVNFNEEGDAYFPPYEMYEWNLLKEEEHSVSDDTPLSWDFFLFEKEN